MQESQQLFLGGGLWSRIVEEFQHPEPSQNSSAIWQIFQSNKSASTSRKKGFFKNHVPKKQEIGSFFVCNGSEL
jgi:hypothetical protein